jgi:putative polyhydroxyalkanoate system protein
VAWAEDAEAKFQMECTVIAGKTADTVEFKRSGVSGSLHVAADHFTLHAKLGFLLGAFSKTIEAEITKALDELLAGSAGSKAAVAKKVAAKKAK